MMTALLLVKLLVTANKIIFNFLQLLGLIIERQANGKSGRYSKVSVEDVMPRLRNASKW